MFNKYGDIKIPYEITLEMENIYGGVDGEGVADANEFDYHYSRRTMQGVNESERYPKRSFRVKNPHLYDGALGL